MIEDSTYKILLNNYAQMDLRRNYDQNIMDEDSDLDLNSNFNNASGILNDGRIDTSFEFDINDQFISDDEDNLSDLY